jgi:hypothetical protein
MEQNDHFEEIPGLKAVLSAGREMPFAIPVGYFDELEERLNDRARLEQRLSASSGDFPVAEGYFEELPSRIESVLFLENLKKQAGDEGFSIPGDYFDTLAGRINNKIQETPVREEARIIRLTPLIRYAAAACIVALTAVTLLLNFRAKTMDQQLAEIPDQEIIQYLQVNSAPGDMVDIRESAGGIADIAVAGPSDKAIEEYLENTL